MAFPKYESYKDSGEDWLGKIPENWQVLRTKSIFRLVAEPAPKNNNEELLSIYSDIGVKPRKELEERGNKASTTDGYWFVKKGDVIVNKLLAWMGAIGVSEYDGVTSPAYDILRAYKPVDSKFYHYLFRSPICTSKLKQHSKGIMEMRLRLYFDEFGNIKIPYPPLEEQKRIVAFLERTTTEIDEAIAKKQRLIELLQEQKAILINQAVTKGLNPKAPMRDSGVEWLGEIPEHWKKIKLKYFIDLLSGFAFKSSSYSMSNEDIPLLRGININPRTIKWDETVYWPKGKVNKFENYLLEENDIVIGMDRPWISSGIRIARIKYCDLPCLLLQRVARIRAIKPLTQAYLELILNSESFHSYFEPMLTGISVPHISPEQIKIFETYIPDEFEQNIICNFVE